MATNPWLTNTGWGSQQGGVTTPSSFDLKPTTSSAGGDSQYQSKINALNTRLQNQNLAFKQREYMTREQFGFDPDFAENPYTRANLLARKAQQRFTTTTNSMASRGQLYSGALNRARASDEFTSGSELDATRREYAEMLQGINEGRLEAQSEYGLSTAESYGDLLSRLEERAKQPELFDAGGGGGGKGKKGKKGKKKK